MKVSGLMGACILKQQSIIKALPDFQSFLTALLHSKLIVNNSHFFLEPISLLFIYVFSIIALVIFGGGLIMLSNRTMVFIDGANLYMGVKYYLKQTKQIAIDALAKKLVGDRELVRIYYYNTPSPSTEPEQQKANQRFLSKLGWIDNLQIRLGRIMKRTNAIECEHCHKTNNFKTHIQKGVDTRIVVDMITLAFSDAYDIAILVSGDSDLSEAVDCIREHTRKKVENACVPNKSWSKTLREASDVRIPLTIDYVKDLFVS